MAAGRIVYGDFSGISKYSSIFAENSGNNRKYERIVYYLYCIPDDAVYGAYFDRIASGREDQKFNTEYGYYGKRVKGCAMWVEEIRGLI